MDGKRPEDLAMIEQEEWARAVREWEAEQRRSGRFPRPPWFLMRHLRWPLRLVGAILIGGACGLLALLGVILALRTLS